ncbi:hypothetical protein [Absidia glauca]|uniref:Uncharacterized protein n=1 Tax=Absidia glauca TaxID=4829 RepID=A0A168S021_ABSGL|nr:hypothetical protein [Absidia glauca]
MSKASCKTCLVLSDLSQEVPSAFNSLPSKVIISTKVGDRSLLQRQLTGGTNAPTFFCKRQGTGSGAMGRHTKSGGYKVDWTKVRTFVVPDLEGFTLAPYVSRKTTLVPKN